MSTAHLTTLVRAAVADTGSTDDAVVVTRLMVTLSQSEKDALLTQAIAATLAGERAEHEQRADRQVRHSEYRRTMGHALHQPILVA